MYLYMERLKLSRIIALLQSTGRLIETRSTRNTGNEQTESFFRLHGQHEAVSPASPHAKPYGKHQNRPPDGADDDDNAGDIIVLGLGL